MGGAYWLLDLPDACRSGGLDVSTFDGWETRSRSSGGYDDVLGVGYHHDASNVNSDEGSSDAYGWLYADDRPIGAMRLHRDGRLVVGAAGATNTMGRGGPLTVSGGVIPLDRGNQTMIAIEAANNGVGETWPKVQVDAYVALVAALCDWYGLDPTTDVFGHFDYVAPSCPSRKIDPAGPAASPYTDLQGPNSAGTWSLTAFRGHVAAWTGNPPPPSGYAQGIDVSKWQGDIDWVDVEAAGYVWCATRIWDRQTDPPAPDVTFAYNRDEMAFARWRFLYYWLEPRRVAAAVDECLSTVGQLRVGEGIMLDAEQDGITEAECVEWLEAVEARTGVPCAVYTGAYVAGGTIWRSPRIFDGRRARVFAAYTDEDEARRHADGIAWDAWQYSATGTVPGVDADCDLDRIDNPAAFDRCTVGGDGPDPPPNGGTDMAAIMPTIRKGDRGDYVERMQHLLAAAGYMNPTNAANYDGVWGNGTDAAKARFDNDHGLTPSPPTDCGAKSWESLLTGKKW